jgi:hypothetical protein
LSLGGLLQKHPRLSKALLFGENLSVKDVRFTVHVVHVATLWFPMIMSPMTYINFHIAHCLWVACSESCGLFMWLGSKPYYYSAGQPIRARLSVSHLLTAMTTVGTRPLRLVLSALGSPLSCMSNAYGLHSGIGPEIGMTWHISVVSVCVCVCVCVRERERERLESHTLNPSTPEYGLPGVLSPPDTCLHV